MNIFYADVLYLHNLKRTCSCRCAFMSTYAVVFQRWKRSVAGDVLHMFHACLWWWSNNSPVSAAFHTLLRTRSPAALSPQLVRAIKCLHVSQGVMPCLVPVYA